MRKKEISEEKRWAQVKLNYKAFKYAQVNVKDLQNILIIGLI